MKEQTYVAPSRQGKVSVAVWLDPEFRRELKIAAVASGRTLQDLIEESLHKTYETMSDKTLRELQK